MRCSQTALVPWLGEGSVTIDEYLFQTFGHGNDRDPAIKVLVVRRQRVRRSCMVPRRRDNGDV